MKTTKVHFNAFVNECEKWIDIYGLRGYQWIFQHEFQEGLRGCVNIDHQARIAVVYLSTEWNDVLHPNERLVRKCAFHEITEVFLCRLIAYANWDAAPTTKGEIEEETHSVIRTLENILWVKYRKY